MTQKEIRMIKRIFESTGKVRVSLTTSSTDLKIISMSGDFAVLSDNREYNIKYLDFGLFRLT